MMQQQTSPTTNVQIKLITDARKLLEKVRSQQCLSADSSLDSSFLFDALTDIKEVDVEIKKGGKTKDDLGLTTKFCKDKNPSEVNEDNEKSRLSPDLLSFLKEVNEPELQSNNDDGRLVEGPKGETNAISKGDSKHVDNSKKDETEIHDDNKSVAELHSENVKLMRENYQLHEEMDDFEYKLYCLEHSLGIIQDVEESSKNLHLARKDSDSTLESDLPNALPLGVTMGKEGDDNRLSPITAMVADAILAGTGVVDVLGSKTESGNQKSSLTLVSTSQEDELKVLRQNNAKMVTAIKALAQATIAQTRKHYLYKKRHHMTKQMVAEESVKANQLMIERDQLTNEFYETRTKFLKEQDIREELSNELKDLVKKNSKLRKDKQRHEKMRQKILERVESRDDDISVLSRLSQSSCFPILQTITEAGPAQAQKDEQSRRDKNLEKLIFKLISQLKKRDEKIKKLEKKLKITMQYLQGALELEVARQDADLATQKESTRSEQKTKKKPPLRPKLLGRKVKK